MGQTFDINVIVIHKIDTYTIFTWGKYLRVEGSAYCVIPNIRHCWQAENCPPDELPPGKLPPKRENFATRRVAPLGVLPPRKSAPQG